MKEHRTFFIAGAPRSGTTLLMQLLAYVTDIEYVDNLVARFDADPVRGMLLKKELFYAKKFTGQSDFGRTRDISEPHEFGRFWRTRLDHSDMREMKNACPDLEKVAAEIEAMKNAADSDLMLKAFILIFYIDRYIAMHDRNCVVVHVKRSELSNALSIAKLRVARGEIFEPQSLMTIAAQVEENPYRQILTQIRSINERIQRLSEIGFSERCLCVSYENLCSDPVGTITEFCKRSGLEFDSTLLRAVSPMVRSPTERTLDRVDLKLLSSLREFVVDV